MTSADPGLWGAILAAALVHLAGAMSPGPNFVIVGRNSMAGGFRAGATTALGVAIGSIGHAALALVGISALLAAMPAVYRGIQIAGGLYLVWLGIQMWRAPKIAPDTPNSPLPEELGGFSLRSGFFKGLAVQLTNAKAGIFFVSVFAASLPPHAPHWALATIAALVFLNALIWYGLVARFFAIGRVRRGYLRWQRCIDRVTGTVMIGFGARLLVPLR